MFSYRVRSSRFDRPLDMLIWESGRLPASLSALDLIRARVSRSRAHSLRRARDVRSRGTSWLMPGSVAAWVLWRSVHGGRRGDSGFRQGLDWGTRGLRRADVGDYHYQGSAAAPPPVPNSHSNPASFSRQPYPFSS